MSFDGSNFVRHVAKRLVQEFEFSAGAGTPGLIGAAKEYPARVQLQSLMPEGIAVGSGIIIDSYGGLSKQQDIVIYEKLCPLFTHNGAAEATYFPVEGVIAVGEVKSTLNKQELEDAFEKCQSVKQLRRHTVATDDGMGLEPAVSRRLYGASTSFSCAKVEEFNQEMNSLDQIYFFVICQKFGASPRTMLNNSVEFIAKVGVKLGPNFIASLQDGFIIPHNSKSNSITRAAFESDGLIFCEKSSDSFPQLMKMLRIYFRSGSTVCREHYDRYFRDPNSDGGIPVSARISFQK